METLRFNLSLFCELQDLAILYFLLLRELDPRAQSYFINLPRDSCISVDELKCQVTVETARVRR